MKRCCESMKNWADKHYPDFFDLVDSDWINYLEVSHHDEPRGAEPPGGEAGGVEDAVLVLLDHVSVAQQADQHHWRRRGKKEMTNREERTVFVGQKVMQPHFFLFQEQSPHYKPYLRCL